VSAPASGLVACFTVGGVFDQLDGATRLFPIIGDPIDYVESPVRLTRTLAARGHNGLCVPIRVPAGKLPEAMDGLAAMLNVDGVLVTMPHEFEALNHCATRSERTRLLGVVSVMRRNEDRTWHGDMLDGLAFLRAQQNQGAKIENGRALLLGAGGAGRAIAIALLDAGVREVIVHDPDSARVQSLVELMNSPRIVVGAPDPSGCDLVFNATNMGMEADDPSPIDVSLLDQSMFVGDVIAGHGTTPLVQAARSAGCGTATGTQMVEAVQDLMADFLLGTTPDYA
jgi:shikimate dehydrogenase